MWWRLYYLKHFVSNLNLLETSYVKQLPVLRPGQRDVHSFKFGVTNAEGTSRGYRYYTGRGLSRSPSHYPPLYVSRYILDPRGSGRNYGDAWRIVGDDRTLNGQELSNEQFTTETLRSFLVSKTIPHAQ